MDQNEYQIKRNDFFSCNEIEMSTRIIEIPNYENYFNPILESSNLYLSEMNNSFLFNKMDIELNKNLLLIKYKNNENQKNNEKKNNFINLFDTSLHAKQKILNVIESYKYLLSSLQILEEKEFVLLNIHPKHITINNQNNPIINNFKYSFHYQTTTMERISNLIIKVKIEMFVFLPVEFHILFYILNTDVKGISQQNIAEILNGFIIHFKTLNIFSNSFIEKYGEKIEQQFQKYINQTKKDVFRELLKTCKQWNNYGLSILYLVILRDMFKKTGFTINPFLINFSQLLVQNIHFDNEKRNSCDENISLLNDILFLKENNYLSLIKSI